MNIEKYTADGQDAKIVEKVHGKLIDMLTVNESINYIALQKKPAVTLLPDSITVSNKRIFLCEFTKLGLAMNFDIFQWRDIKDIAFKEEIFGSKVTVIPYTGENLTIDYIPKVQARKLYQLIKTSLENIRKEKIDFPKPAEPQQPVPPTPAAAAPTEKQVKEKTVPPLASPVSQQEDDITKKLSKLKSLFDKQLISQAEYENKKAEILKDL